MQDYDYFSTNDLALASALTTQGYSIEAIDRPLHSRRAAFLFARTNALTQVVDDYWSDQLQVSPKAYFDALKHLKTRLYAGV
ncbi:MAG: DUF5659 domain-containing protein [Candidatus Saccharimonadales bacterium]